jgi:hypothetical protein
MNVILLTAEQAEQVSSMNGNGQHRLSPIPLSDGRFFLPANVLDETGVGGIFEGRICSQCETTTIETIEHLM